VSELHLAKSSLLAKNLGYGTQTWIHHALNPVKICHATLTSMETSCSSLTSALLLSQKSHPPLQPIVRLAVHHRHMPQHHASGLRSLTSDRTRVDPTSCVNHLPEHTTHLVRVESSGRLVSAECQYALLLLFVEINASSFR
jgi:hypothetical protein